MFNSKRWRKPSPTWDKVESPLQGRSNAPSWHSGRAPFHYHHTHGLEGVRDPEVQGIPLPNSSACLQVVTVSRVLAGICLYLAPHGHVSVPYLRSFHWVSYALVNFPSPVGSQWPTRVRHISYGFFWFCNQSHGHKKPTGGIHRGLWWGAKLPTEVDKCNWVVDSELWTRTNTRMKTETKSRSFDTDECSRPPEIPRENRRGQRILPTTLGSDIFNETIPRVYLILPCPQILCVNHKILFMKSRFLLNESFSTKLRNLSPWSSISMTTTVRTGTPGSHPAASSKKFTSCQPLVMHDHPQGSWPEWQVGRRR